MFAEPFLSGLHKMGVQLGLGATLVGCRKFSPPCSFYCTEDARSNYDNLQKLHKPGFLGYILFLLFQKLNQDCNVHPGSS